MERARSPAYSAGSEKKGAGTKRTSEKKGAAPRCTSEEKADFVGGFMHTESAGPFRGAHQLQRSRCMHHSATQSREGRVPTRHGRGPGREEGALRALDDARGDDGQPAGCDPRARGSGADQCEAHKSRESEYSEVSLRVLHFDSWRGARTLIADGLATSPTSASSGRSAPGLEGLEG